MSFIARLGLMLAAPIAALIVARDSLQFGLVQTFVAIFLIVIVVGILAISPRLWRSVRGSSSRQN